MGGRGGGSGGSSGASGTAKKDEKASGGGPSKELKGKDEKEFILKKSEQYKKTLTDKEIAALREYQGAAYRSINKALRTGKNISKADKETIKRIDKAISKNKIGKNTILYRGLKQNEINRLMKTKVGSKVKDKGYISTSTSKNAANIFARGKMDVNGRSKSVIAKYTIKSTTKGIHIPSMNKSRGTKTIKDKEKEIILGRNKAPVFKGFSTRGKQVIANFVI